METRVVKGVEEVVTQGMPVAERIVTGENGSMDTVATEEATETAETTEVMTGASEDGVRDAESGPSAKSHRRTRQRKSFTMDDEVYNLLGTLAKTNGTNRSAFIEQLILMANELSLTPQIQDLLGVMATRAGMTRTQYLEMLVLKADAVVTWQPPQLKPKPWWNPWAKPEWEDQDVPLVSRIVEGATPPQLPHDDRQ